MNKELIIELAKESIERELEKIKENNAELRELRREKRTLRKLMSYE